MVSHWCPKIRTLVRTLAATLVVAVVTQGLYWSAAMACGVSADGISACSLAEHEEETRPRWRVGVSSLYTSTAIRFTDSLRSDETRAAVVASLAYQLSRTTTLQAVIGSTFGGHLTTPTGRYDFSPGPTAAVGASWRFGTGDRPFVLLTSNLSFSASTTHASDGGAATGSVGYDAFDLRLGALVGMTVLEVLRPYAVGRVFGGPVYWQYQGANVTGGDTHHYQIGAGLTATIGRRFSLFAEAVPLGERSIAGGAAISI